LGFLEFSCCRPHGKYQLDPSWLLVIYHPVVAAAVAFILLTVLSDISDPEPCNWKFFHLGSASCLRVECCGTGTGTGTALHQLITPNLGFSLLLVFVRFAQENGLMFLEASAKTGECVEEAFLKCSKSILAKIETGELDPERIGSGTALLFLLFLLFCLESSDLPHCPLSSSFLCFGIH
jgi:hypothetical protein